MSNMLKGVLSSAHALLFIPGNDIQQRLLDLAFGGRDFKGQLQRCSVQHGARVVRCVCGPFLAASIMTGVHNVGRS